MHRILMPGAVLVGAFLVLACGEDSPLTPGPEAARRAELSPSATRGRETVPFKQSYEAVGTLAPAADCPVLQERLRGGGRATDFGRYTVTNSHCIDPATGALTQGVFVQSIASGDQVSGTYTGTATPVPDNAGEPANIGTFTVEVLVEFTDGTGRFTALSGTATGHGTARIDFSLPEPRSEVSLRFEGQISSPGSLK